MSGRDAARTSTVDIELQLLLEARLPALPATTSATTRWPRCGGACGRRWTRFGCATHLAAAGPRAARARACSRSCCSTSPCRSARCSATRPTSGRCASRCVPVLRDLSVAQALGRRLQHRRGGVVAGDPAARGRAARAHASSTPPTSTREALRSRRGRRLRARPHRAVQPRTTGAPAARGSLSDYYTAAYGGAVFDRRLQDADRLLRPQPGHRQRVLRGASGLVPQRADLLRPRAAGPRDRPVPRRAGAPRLPRPRQQGDAALRRARRRVRRAVRSRRAAHATAKHGPDGCRARELRGDAGRRAS